MTPQNLPFIEIEVVQRCLEHHARGRFGTEHLTPPGVLELHGVVKRVEARIPPGGNVYIQMDQPVREPHFPTVPKHAIGLYRS